MDIKLEVNEGLDYIKLDAELRGIAIGVQMVSDFMRRKRLVELQAAKEQPVVQQQKEDS
jgi:hypothetical protein